MNTNRREFLKAGAATLATAALGELAIGQTKTAGDQKSDAGSPPRRKLKKAVHIGMVSGDMPLLEKFKLLKELGFDGVELDSPSKLNPDEVVGALKATGLEVSEVVDSVHWSQTLSHPDPAVRAKGREGLETALRDSQRFGSSTVLLVPAVVNKDVSYADAYTRSQEEIRKVLPTAEKLGVKITIENVWNQFLLSPLEAARYVDEFQSPWVGWHFDVGNIVNYGWPEQWIRILGKRILKLHIKEYSRKKRDENGLWKGFEVDLLDGDCDWPAVMKALDEIGYEGWGTAEIPGGDRARLTEIAKRMDRIYAS